MAELAVRHAPQYPATSWLKPLPPATRLILHGGPKVRGARCCGLAGRLRRRGMPGTIRGTRATLWMGPDEYLLLDTEVPPAVAADLAQALATRRTRSSTSATARSHLRFRGRHAEAILNGGCPLDLDIASFPVGMCTRTLCGKADIVLWRTGAFAFHVEVWRSFSDYSARAADRDRAGHRP